MNATSIPPAGAELEARDSWLPMVIIAMGQALMSFNVAALPVSIGGMVESFNTAPTTIGTAIVMYSLFVSGFIMLGAKIGQKFGSKRVFQIVVAIFGVAMVLMTASPSATVMVAAQGLAGAAGAGLVPTLVVLIATHYRGRQQAEAVGWLGAARAMAGVLAFLVVGFMGTLLSWRYAFALLVVHAAAILVLSFKLKPIPGDPDVRIDWTGVALAASAIILISMGFNNLNGWGVLLANAAAPFTVLGVSPAPLMVIVGIVLGQSFLVWTRRRAQGGRTPLISLTVVESAAERAAVMAMFTIVMLEAAINFSVPLYIQIVQGSSSLQTAFAMMPFNLSVFFAAILVVKFYDRFTPQRIARVAFSMVAVGLFWLAFVVRNDWSTFPVLVGLVVVGLAQGALVTLLFNVLVTASPKELAGDVGSLRGTTNNLAAAVGTAMIGAVLVGLLSANIVRDVASHPEIPAELMAQIDVDSINFISNDRLQNVLAATTATPAQVDAAMLVNTESRLRALKIGFLVLASLALLAIVPSGRLPDYTRGALPVAGKPDDMAAVAAAERVVPDAT